MHVTDSFTYPAGLETVRTMATNPQFVRSRLNFPGVEPAKITVEERDADTVVHMTVTISETALPDAARRFVKKGVSADVTETWSPISDGTCHVTMDLSVQGAPVTARALSTLNDQGASTQRSVDADFHVKVPLIGKSIEQRAATRVSLLWKNEVRAAEKWLADHPQD